MRALEAGVISMEVVTNSLDIVLIQSASLGAEGWRGGEDSVARTTGSTTECRSDRTPQPECFPDAVVSEKYPDNSETANSGGDLRG